MLARAVAVAVVLVLAKAVQAEMDTHLIILDIVVITDLPPAANGGSLGSAAQVAQPVAQVHKVLLDLKAHLVL
jgi:hypothetical protein